MPAPEPGSGALWRNSKTRLTFKRSRPLDELERAPQPLAKADHSARHRCQRASWTLCPRSSSRPSNGALRRVYVRLVPVAVRLVGAVDRDANVVALLLREHRELRAQGRQVKAGDLLVELLREEVHVLGILARVALLPELKLRERLVRE